MVPVAAGLIELSAAFMPLACDIAIIWLAYMVIRRLLAALVRWWRPVAFEADLKSFDSFDDEVETKEAAGSVTTRVQRLLAYEFKAEFGDLRYNKANRLLAGDWVRKRMKDMGMRPLHITRLSPMTTELCLVPSVEGIEAQRFAASGLVQGRRAVVELPR